MENQHARMTSGQPSRPSRRRYPPKNCKKPDCSKLYIPTNKRQEFCCPQHRIDYNNDQRDLKELPFKLLSKKLAHNQAVLKRIYASLNVHKQNSFTIQLLQYDNYNFGFNTDRSVNTDTGNEIEWNYNYGLEGKDVVKKTFIIHFRKTISL